MMRSDLWLWWFDIKNLLLGKVASSEYIKEVFGIRYRIKSCEYDKAENRVIELWKKSKTQNNKLKRI